MSSLFEHPGLNDSAYENLRSSNHPVDLRARAKADQLWEVFTPYADPEFEVEFRAEIHSRWWEMYLTTTLVERRRHVECPKPGPDVLVLDNGLRTWVEAIAPTQGDTDSQDRVPDLELNVVRDYPETRILLRYRAAIREKHNKHDKYVQEGRISPSDAYVIAVNSANIPLAFVGSTIPDILKAVFPIGHMQVHIRTSDLKAVGTDYQYRGAVEKLSGSLVDTDIFLNPDYGAISAVIFSTSSATRYPQESGDDFVLVHNPCARNPLSPGWLGFGVEYTAKTDDSVFELIKLDHTDQRLPHSESWHCVT